MNKKGFTLVELLSVIVLIGLLLGIGVPGVMRISKKMKERSFNTKKEQIEQAATLWGQDNRTRLSKSTCKVLESSVEKEYPCYKISIKELIEEDYLDMIFGLCDKYNTNDYYVNMAVAWLISICYIKYPDITIKYIKNNKLDDFTHNKVIQKIRESYRVSREDKIYLNGLKRK